MTRTTPARAIVFALAASCLASWLVAAQGEPGAPLKLEDVVRRFVQGASTEELIRWINASQVDFDLSDEMIDELAVAGLPRPVIDAMIARQHELTPPEERAVEPPSPAEETGTILSFFLNPDDREVERRRLRIPDRLPPGLASAWGIDPAGDGARITEIGLYVACATSYHVPDHWRSKSPLGRDFVSMPRHRMIAFFPGAEWKKAGILRRIGSMLEPSLQPSGGGGVAAADVQPGAGAPGTLTFELPRRVDVELEPGEAHDLSLGIALEVGGRYYRLLDATLADLPVGDADLRFRAQFESLGNPSGLDIELEPLPDDWQEPAPDAE